MSLITPNWPAPANIKACTTVRSIWGGPNQPEESTSNRARLVSALSLPADPVWLKQTHSTIVVEAKPEFRDAEADASYSDQPKQICLVLTADCLPVLICNRQGTQVAAAHAGWRGLANGIIENTVNTLESDPADLLVWLGPAIGPEKFEVGDDVYQAFTRQDPESTSCFIATKPGKWLANLYDLARRRLNKLGVTEIFGGEFCTHTQEQLFYSWRRDQQKAGRMASLIWIDQI
jgi:YfiH family protein